MYLDINDEYVKNFFAEVIAIGIRRHEEILRPSEKTINKTKAIEYLKRVGLPPSTLDKMIANKKIKAVKMGDSKNSSVLFSANKFFNAVDQLRIAKYSSLFY